MALPIIKLTGREVAIVFGQDYPIDEIVYQHLAVSRRYIYTIGGDDYYFDYQIVDKYKTFFLRFISDKPSIKEMSGDTDIQIRLNDSVDNMFNDVKTKVGAMKDGDKADFFYVCNSSVATQSYQVLYVLFEVNKVNNADINVEASITDSSKNRYSIGSINLKDIKDLNYPEFFIDIIIDSKEDLDPTHIGGAKAIVATVVDDDTRSDLETHDLRGIPDIKTDYAQKIVDDIMKFDAAESGPSQLIDLIKGNYDTMLDSKNVDTSNYIDSVDIDFDSIRDDFIRSVAYLYSLVFFKLVKKIKGNKYDAIIGSDLRKTTATFGEFISLSRGTPFDFADMPLYGNKRYRFNALQFFKDIELLFKNLEINSLKDDNGTMRSDADEITETTIELKGKYRTLRYDNTYDPEYIYKICVSDIQNSNPAKVFDFNDKLDTDIFRLLDKETTLNFAKNYVTREFKKLQSNNRLFFAEKFSITGTEITNIFERFIEFDVEYMYNNGESLLVNDPSEFENTIKKTILKYVSDVPLASIVKTGRSLEFLELVEIEKNIRNNDTKYDEFLFGFFEALTGEKFDKNYFNFQSSFSKKFEATVNESAKAVLENNIRGITKLILDIEKKKDYNTNFELKRKVAKLKKDKTEAINSYTNL